MDYASVFPQVEKRTQSFPLVTGHFNDRDSGFGPGGLPHANVSSQRSLLLREKSQEPGYSVIVAFERLGFWFLLVEAIFHLWCREFWGLVILWFMVVVVVGMWFIAPIASSQTYHHVPRRRDTVWEE